MKRFLIRITAFMVIGVVWMAGNYAVNRYLFQADALVPAATRLLIIGDSHTRRGLDPKRFQAAVNASQLGEPAYITYYKLRHLLDRAPKMDTAIIIFGYHSLSSFNDVKLLDYPENSAIFNRYYMLDEIARIPGVPIDGAIYLQVLIRRMCLYPSRRHTALLGMFSTVNEVRLGNHDLAIKQQFYHGDGMRGNSDVCERYIRMMVQLCRERQVRPILLATPLHADYVDRVPPAFIASYEALKAELQADGVDVWDYARADFPDEEFYDANHLNTRGAARFSQLIQQRLSD